MRVQPSRRIFLKKAVSLSIVSISLVRMPKIIPMPSIVGLSTLEIIGVGSRTIGRRWILDSTRTFVMRSHG